MTYDERTFCLWAEERELNEDELRSELIQSAERPEGFRQLVERDANGVLHHSSVQSLHGGRHKLRRSDSDYELRGCSLGGRTAGWAESASRCSTSVVLSGV